MIKLSKFNSKTNKKGEFILNAEIIETIEETPDTVVTLTNGKKLIVDVTSEDSDRGEQNTINSFEHEIYYPISEWASLKAGTNLDDVVDDVPAPTDADAPAINAADADDASNTTEEY